MNSQVGVTVPRPRSFRLFFLYILAVIGGLQVATQVVAFMFRYQAALGPSWNNVYPPWCVFVWALDFGVMYSDVFLLAAGFGLGVYFFALIPLILGRRRALMFSHVTADLYGSAHWANKQEVESTGLVRKNGAFSNKETLDSVLVGGWRQDNGRLHYLWHSGPEHVMADGASRTGKGVSLVVPTLLAWGASCFVRDLKGELWSMTSGWRMLGARNKVVRFAPGSVDSEYCWNPLDEVRLGTPSELADVYQIAYMLIDQTGEGFSDNHWKQTSHALLMGIILHCLYRAVGSEKRASLSVVAHEIVRTDRPLDDLWDEMKDATYINGGSHDFVAGQAMKAKLTPRDEFGSTVSTLFTALTLYMDPVVEKNMSSSDFRLDDMMNSSSPMTLYLVTTPQNNDRMIPFVRLMLNLMIRRLAGSMEYHEGSMRASYKHRLLLLLDEFASLGRMPVFARDLSYMAGYGIKCYFIVQDYNQLIDEKTGYGRTETISANCHIHLALTPNDQRVAEKISRRLGKTTVIKKHVNNRRRGLFMEQDSVSYQESQRDLMTPDEVLQLKPATKCTETGKILKPGHMLIMKGGAPPIYGEQPLYFQEPAWSERSKVPPGVSPKSSNTSSQVQPRSLDVEVSL